MAKNMGNDEVLSSSIVVTATLLSSITPEPFWVFLLPLPWSDLEGIDMALYFLTQFFRHLKSLIFYKNIVTK